MDLGFYLRVGRRLPFGLLWLACGFLIGPLRVAAADLPVPGAAEVLATNEFDSVGTAVLQLLQDRDAGKFATNMVVANEDWLSMISSNMSAEVKDQIQSYTNHNEVNRQQLEKNADAFLKRADALHLDFTKGDWHFHIITPRQMGKMYLSQARDEKLTVPYLDKLEIILNTNNVASAANTATNDNFTLMISALEKFPGGWRIGFPNYVQWVSVPDYLTDQKTVVELNLLEKAASHEGFSGGDDPALLKLGAALVDFIRAQSTEVYAKEALYSPDLAWNQFRKAVPQGGPSRSEFDTEVKAMLAEEVKSAQSVVQIMQGAGIDLKDADIQIKRATVERCQAQGSAVVLDGLMGTHFTLELAVQTDAKARNGTSLSGDYALAINQICRMGDDWKVMQSVHWAKLPNGVVGNEMTASIKYENYVGQYGTLPPETMAPEIAFTPLAGGNLMHLSDLRGKVVILDFWATWCGPCQQPMADLQTLRQAHADWQDKVAIVPISIDDTMEIVRDHINKKGWTNTFNVWAGDGGWHSAPADTFRVRMVPTTYIIDAQGKIVTAGHPAGINFGDTVDRLLKP